jgi:SSS family solute:Na+ symporter
MAHAGKEVLGDMFGFPGWLSVIIVVGVTVLYTTSGGLRASVITDAFQFSAFAILLPVVLLLALAFHLEGGFDAFIERGAAATAEGVANTTPIEVIGFIAAFFLGETLIPPYANRALASKTTGVSRNGFILAGVFSAVWFLVMVSLGIVARGLVPAGTGEDHVLLNLVKTIMPTEGYMLLLIVTVSVIMSSLDSLLNAGAVAFTQDIARPIGRLTGASSLTIGRCATVAIALVAAVGTAVVPSIIDGLLICYTIWASAILPALILGLWLPRPRPLAAILSMSVGTAVSMIAIVLLLVLPGAGRFSVIIVPALATALLAYLVGHTFASKQGGKA